ncbi:MAG: OmpA family protein [Bacteroidales bacterium]|jgi:outer membrane protein OmpA-like peptidoglycan-associated protein/tetratricopeptide (TPR) repeat protein|nr:OmpA family protein [Bacteroidales bacterium]
MVKNIIPALLLVICVSLHAQENPKIDKKELLSLSDDGKEIKKAVKQGDSYYKNGLYDAALQHYMKLYRITDEYSPLNYKIGVSHLYGVQPKNALSFFNRTYPDVAFDYYCLKGIALIYNQQYKEAKETFYQYMETLSPKRAKKETDKITRFIAICDFSAKAVEDSLPAYVINAGPEVNSYYDDYSAVELLSPSLPPSLYFTSRRPEDDDLNFADHSVYPERILFSSEFVNGKANEAKEASVTSYKHMSVAGVDNETYSLLYYKGKKRFGDIYRTQFKEKNGNPTNKRRLKRVISKKTSKESSISFTENGDAYFISDRLGGEGGKDIWYASKKGKRSFKRPRNVSALNTPLNEESVFVTPDGNTLYFSTNGRPGMGGFDVYKSQKTEIGGWGEPVNMGYPINSPDDDLFYRLTSDTTIALLSSKRSGGFGGLDIYAVKKDLRIPFELSGNVTDVKTGKTLAATIKLFDKTTDFPVATATNDTVQQRYVLNMEDTSDYYLQAEAIGYRSVTENFTNPTTRHAKVEQNFALEKLLHPYTLNGYITNVKTGKPVQAEMLIKAAGKDDVLYRTVSDENSGFYTVTLEDKINVDIAVKATDYFDHNESLQLKNIKEASGSKNITLQRSITSYAVTGIITEEGSNAPLKADISVSKAGDGQFAQKITTAENGKYELPLPDDGPFLLEITSEGHFFANGVLQFDADSTLLVRNFALKKMESGVKVVIENILFNTGKSTLLPQSFSELNKLVNLLRENPNVRIEISGHTDNVGSAATNKKLSKNRALSVRNYLISQGITGERVEYEGYGFERPIAPNDTEEGRAANRRVEIEILN